MRRAATPSWLLAVLGALLAVVLGSQVGATDEPRTGSLQRTVRSASTDGVAPVQAHRRGGGVDHALAGAPRSVSPAVGQRAHSRHLPPAAGPGVSATALPTDGAAAHTGGRAQAPPRRSPTGTRGRSPPNTSST